MTAATDQASEVAAILIERDIERIARSMAIREFQSLHISIIVLGPSKNTRSNGLLNN